MAVITPDIPEIFEEAFERAGLTMRTGYDLKTIRRSLNLIQLEWQNRGLNLFTVDSGTVSLVAGTASYTMPTDTIDLIEHQLRTGTGTGQTDYNIRRASVSTYAKQTNKNTQGRPTIIYVDRQASQVDFYLWPVPDSSDYSLAYYRLKGIDGLEKGVEGTANIPPRFVPALTAGLAYHIAMKKPEAERRIPMLRSEYENQYRLAAEEDQDSSSWIVSMRASI